MNADISDGSILVQSGQLQIEGTSVMLDQHNGNNITVKNGSTLSFNGLTGNVVRPIVLESNTIIGTSGNNSSVLGSNITLLGDMNITNTNNNGTGSITFNGNIGGNFAINKNNGPGTSNTAFVLGGSNTFTGGLNVNGGTFIVGCAML